MSENTDVANNVSEITPKSSDLYTFLELDQVKLSPLRERYVRLSTRQVNITQIPMYVTDARNNIEVFEGMQNVIADKAIRVKLESEAWNNYSRLDFLNAVSNLGKKFNGDDKDHPEFLFPGVIKNLIKGNSVANVLEGKGNCLDYAITTKLLSRLYYSDVQVDIIPFALKSIAAKGKEPDHFGMHVKLSTNEAAGVDTDWFVLAGGLSVPLEVMNVDEKTQKGLYEYVSENIKSKSGEKDENQLRRAVGMFRQVYRNWKRKQ